MPLLTVDDAMSGTSLAEVVSVVITPHSHAKECQLHGEIHVDDCEGTLCIFKAHPDSPHTINTSNRSLLLSNTDRSILAINPFTVVLELKDKNEDTEFISGSFSWPEGICDTLLVERIEGKLGVAEVSYVVHWAAVETFISATLDIKSVERNVIGIFLPSTRTSMMRKIRNLGHFN